MQVDISPYLWTVAGYLETSRLVGVMGLDLSLTSTGWAYLERGGALSFGVIAPKRPYRLGQISNAIAKLLDVCHPDFLSIEEVLRGCMRFTMLDVGMGTGAALSQVELYQMAHKPTPTLFQSPIRLKKFVSLEPDVDKTHLQKYVAKVILLSGQRPEGLLPKAKRAKGDVCDAVTLVMSGLAAYGVYKGLIARDTVPTWFYEPDKPKKGKKVVFNDYISQFDVYLKEASSGKTRKSKRA